MKVTKVLVSHCLWHLLSAPMYCVALNLSFPGGAGLSYQNGVLRIKLGGQDSASSSFAIPPPETLPPVSSIQVRNTGTVKGFGAFAKTPLERGAFLGFYQGNVIKTRESLDRLIEQREKELRIEQDGSTSKKSSSAAMDYIMALDGGVTFLDGYERAMDRSKFSPVHLNHADKGTPGCNCVRVLEQLSTSKANEDRFCVAFFTCRNVLAGEELCFDYGNNFWKGREDQKI